MVIGEITLVWIEIVTWVIEKIALEKGREGDRMRGKRCVRCGGCR
jgi:hypothetical protein